VPHSAPPTHDSKTTALDLVSRRDARRDESGEHAPFDQHIRCIRRNRQSSLVDHRLLEVTAELRLTRIKHGSAAVPSAPRSGLRPRSRGRAA